VERTFPPGGQICTGTVKILSDVYRAVGQQDASGNKHTDAALVAAGGTTAPNGCEGFVGSPDFAEDTRLAEIFEFRLGSGEHSHRP
jgi:hypothetical protein